MLVSIRQIGNSYGVIIPKPMLTQAALDVQTGADITIEGTTIMVRKPVVASRVGWAEAAQQLAQSGADTLVGGQPASDAGW
jgi:antitoxin MazE